MIRRFTLSLPARMPNCITAIRPCATSARRKNRVPTLRSILLNTGTALLTLGDAGRGDAALCPRAGGPGRQPRRRRGCSSRESSSSSTSIEAAQQQVALAFAESRVGEASPVTADDFIEAANIFLAMNDFDLARRYYERARQAGAADEVVTIGMANSAIAQGRTSEAQQQLAKLGNPAEFANNFDYTMAQANIYRQQHQQFQAMTAFARANQLGGEDDTAELPCSRRPKSRVCR